MDWRLSAASFFATTWLSAATAQTGLADEWVNERMVAAELVRTTPLSTSAAPVDGATDASRPLAGKDAGVRFAQPKDRAGPAVNAMTRPLAIEK